MNYQEVKNGLKSLARELRDSKKNLKVAQREESLHASGHTPKEHFDYSMARIRAGNGPCALHGDLLKKKWDYRHRHIAYSMLRGRTYEQIESKCREKPDWDYIRGMMGLMRDIREVTHACEAADVRVGQA